MRSSNVDGEKTTQHFAMMSASDFFVGYMRSSMASYITFFLFMLHLAKNEQKGFAMLLVISPAC